jgi:glycosyltransferase involved in cell wall biosynthesis
MLSQNLVSIVIPCHKQAEFLGSAIDSALAQNYRDRELIVVDDGPDDSTTKVADCFETVRCLRQKRSGVAAARNRGLSESNGDFIVFLDADDRLLPRALENGVASLREHRDAAFVYGSVELITADGFNLPTPPQSIVEENHYLELLRHNYIWTTGTVMYRKAILEQAGGFNTSLGGSADVELNLRITRHFPIFCHGQPVLEYRRHPQSMSTDWSLMLGDAVNARLLHRRFVLGQPEYQQALDEGLRSVREYYGDKLVSSIRSDFEHHRWLMATRKLATLSRYFPGRILNASMRRLSSMKPKTWRLS